MSGDTPVCLISQQGEQLRLMESLSRLLAGQATGSASPKVQEYFIGEDVEVEAQPFESVGLEWVDAVATEVGLMLSGDLRDAPLRAI